MPLIVDDKSKDEVLDGLIESIHKLQIHYYKERGWMGTPQREEYRTKIAKLTMAYNMVLQKRIDRADPHRIKSLKVPGPMGEAEKLALLQLIEST
jgi:hypothetical protein